MSIIVKKKNDFWRRLATQIIGLKQLDDLELFDVNIKTTGDLVGEDGVAISIKELVEAVEHLYALPKPFLPKSVIETAADFPTAEEVEIGWCYKVKANVTDNDETKTNTGKSFLAGDEICWFSDTLTWISLGSTALFFRDDATDTLSPSTPNDNLDLGEGTFKGKHEGDWNGNIIAKEKIGGGLTRYRVPIMGEHYIIDSLMTVNADDQLIFERDKNDALPAVIFKQKQGTGDLAAFMLDEAEVGAIDNEGNIHLLGFIGCKKVYVYGSMQQGSAGEEFGAVGYIGDPTSTLPLVFMKGVLPVDQDYLEAWCGEDTSGQFGKGFLIWHDKSTKKYAIYYSTSGKMDGTEVLLFNIDHEGAAFFANGINLNSKKITNVANGTEAGDAVNKSQLDGIDQSKWETEGTSYIKPKSSKKVLSIYTEFVPPDDIGRPYQRNFGVGYPATLPAGFVALPGSYDPYCPDFGNFLDTKNNEIVYIPPFWAKRDETSYGGNLATLIKPLSAYATEAAANADGYYMPDGFFKGTDICGIFFFKYLASKITDGAGFSAGSRRFGLPISTHSTHNPIADLTACTVNQYYQALDAVKAIDGVDGAVNPSSKWFVPCLQQLAILALLTQAQARDDIYCAWRDATKPYPRGNNNNAWSDETDTSIKFISDGFPNCSKTGSADQFAKTTHNGRPNGISDINGPMWWIAPGLTCIATTVNISGISQANPGQVTTASNHGLVNGDKILITGVVGMTQANDKLYEVNRIDDTNFTIGVDTAGWTAYASGGVVRTGTYYVKKRSYDPTLYTSGNAGANDAWGATGVANWGEVLNIAIPVGGASIAQRFGNSTNVVLGNLSDRLSNIGFPKDTNAISTGGTDLWGKDYYYLYFTNECCPIRFGDWDYGSLAGVWYVYLYSGRSSSYTYAGFSACAFGTPVL